VSVDASITLIGLKESGVDLPPRAEPSGRSSCVRRSSARPQRPCWSSPSSRFWAGGYQPIGNDPVNRRW